LPQMQSHALQNNSQIRDSWFECSSINIISREWLELGRYKIW
jgi:hypothetical protein